MNKYITNITLKTKVNRICNVRKIYLIFEETNLLHLLPRRILVKFKDKHLVQL